MEERRPALLPRRRSRPLRTTDPPSMIGPGTARAFLFPRSTRDATPMSHVSRRTIPTTGKIRRLGLYSRGFGGWARPTMSVGEAGGRCERMAKSVLLPPGEGGRRPDEGPRSPRKANEPSSAASRHLLPGGEGLMGDFAILRREAGESRSPSFSQIGRAHV